MIKILVTVFLSESSETPFCVAFTEGQIRFHSHYGVVLQLGLSAQSMVWELKEQSLLHIPVLIVTSTWVLKITGKRKHFNIIHF